ncbi:unnamed protein product [Symbiodinium natans]|uniref:RRM domain-containing protein n=1 Tax=Symbiodinium natans TaxID=878477 RepID=A0A812LP22_9DINO|nr:unnamed protein product [Symbiodinium natans]
MVDALGLLLRPHCIKGNPFVNFTSVSPVFEQGLAPSEPSSMGGRSVPSHHQRLTTSLRDSLQVWGVPRPEPEAAVCRQDWPESADTVTIKNIPCRIRAQEILSAVCALGFTENHLLYLHLPAKQGRNTCTLGYCFIGFRSVALARQFWEKSSELRFPDRTSLKVPHVEAATRSMHGEVLWFRREAAGTEEVDVATGQGECAAGGPGHSEAKDQCGAECPRHSEVHRTPQKTTWLL